MIDATKTPRYLTEYPDVELALRAEAVFERYLRYQLAATEFHEIVRNDRDSGVRLSNTPVLAIKRVMARTRSWHQGLRHYEFLGDMHWTEIPVDHTVLHQSNGKAALIVPTSIFGTVYDEVAVTYTAGVDPLPKDVVDAVHEIAELFRTGEIDEWNCMLPQSVHDVIHRYRREAV